MALHRHILGKVFGLWILLFLSTPMLRAQCDNTLEGRDFWVMFLPNLAGYGEMTLKAYAPANTQIHISCPRQSWDTTINVPTARQVVVPIRASLGGGQYSPTPTNHGLHITSTRPISLYSSFYDYASFDISAIFPTDVLDTTYVMQIYPSFNGSSVGFVAVEDSTWLTMTVPCCTMNPGYGDSLCVDTAGTVRTVFLRRGQCFHLVASRNADLSGMRVTSNGKRFAAFQGAICANVPDGCGACDHLYEQSVPERYWGRRFVIVPTAMQTQGDRVRITSAEDSNQLVLDGSPVATLMMGETYEANVASGVGHLLESSRPAYVCLYIKGHSCSGGPGDPAAVTIPPVEQGVPSVHFQALTTSRTTDHFVNVVTRTADTAGMTIDGQPFSVPFTPMACGYSYVQQPIAAGSHHLASDNGTFEAFFYGLGNYESYAYLAGMALRDLKHSVQVVGGNDSNTTVCIGNEVEFRLQPEDVISTVEWRVDGQTVDDSGTVLHHVFDSVGTHHVEAVLSDGCTVYGIDVLAHGADTVTIRRTLCEGDTLMFGTTVVTDSGSYNMLLTGVDGCDSIIILEVSLQGSSQSTVYDTMCPGTHFPWHGTLLDTVGVYIDTVRSSNGCDSIVTLHLASLTMPKVRIDTAVDCATGSYLLSADFSETVWDGTPHAFGWTAVPPDNLLSGHEHDTLVRVRPLGTTQYSLNIIYRCPFEESVTLEPLTDPHAQIRLVPEVVTYENPVFDAYDISEGTTGRLWLIDDVEQDFTGNPLHHEMAQGEIDVTVGLVVWKFPACRDTAFLPIRLYNETLWSPNVFTPGNGINGRFAILGIGIEQLELDIYNRWGLLVYHTDHPEEGWDGTHNGTPCKQDAYVWRLKYHCSSFPDAYKIKVGTVTLLR